MLSRSRLFSSDGDYMNTFRTCKERHVITRVARHCIFLSFGLFSERR